MTLIRVSGPKGLLSHNDGDLCIQVKFIWFIDGLTLLPIFSFIIILKKMAQNSKQSKLAEKVFIQNCVKSILNKSSPNDVSHWIDTNHLHFCILTSQTITFTITYDHLILDLARMTRPLSHGQFTPHGITGLPTWRLHITRLLYDDDDGGCDDNDDDDDDDHCDHYHHLCDHHD